MDKNVFQVERKRLADQVADQLMSMIADGIFKPGDKLPSEPELMRQFNVGRSSIREAIGALSLVGLLRVRPGQGTSVNHFSGEARSKPFGLLGIGREKIEELVEARIELECSIVRFTAQRATVEDIALIREQQMMLAEAIANKREMIKADLAFHLTVARGCHNSVLVRFMSEMRQPIHHWMTQKAKHDWGYDKVYDQHETILKAIEAGDASAAAEAVKAHLLSTSERLIAAVLSP